MTWTIEPDRDFSTLLETSGYMGRRLDRLDPAIRCLDLDGLVKRMVEDDCPSSTDAVVVDGDDVFFIEFKGGDDPDEMGDDCNPRSKVNTLRMKASDTVNIYHRFLSANQMFDGVKTMTYVVVTEGGFSEMRAKAGRAAGKDCFCPDFLKRFSCRDIHGDRLFFDKVCVMTWGEFCSFIESRFGNPVEEQALSEEPRTV